MDAPARPPRFSVVVPVYRQWDLVPELLAGLAAQVDAPGHELVLVDNEPGAARPSLAHPGLRLVECATPGAYAARNAGTAAASGDWLVFTDADCRPAPGWLAALGAAAGAAPATLLAGPVRVVTSGSHPGPYAAYDRIRGIPQAHYVRLGYAATANLAVPRAAFDAVGGFDAGRFSGGDAAFCRAARHKGYGIRLVPGAVVDHPGRTTWEAIATKARRVKGGQVTGGSQRQRATWALRTLTPPFRLAIRFLRSDAPWPERRAAIAVLFRLWGVELAEMMRLLAGGPPERR